MTSLPLLHISSSPITRIRSCRQEANAHKPCGLWYGIGDAWIEWCREAMPHWLEKVITYEIVLRAEARILRLSSTKALRAFARQYPDGCPPDWRALARQYDGIEIAPYVRGALPYTPSSMWHRYWDCAAGCIWRARAIQSITEVNFPCQCQRSG